ncbi:MAG: acetyl-CoA carboxylase biotin carboxyl carrier protein [FCB group bacterium]|nr:acetyl-CoA carboxylase biotin carboxyl carrier protein [FCB group bacterium]
MDLDKLQELIRIFEASDLSEIEIEESGRRMRLKKPRPVMSYAGQMIPMQPADARGTQMVLHESVTAVPASAPVRAEKEPEKVITIDSPMVGVLYVAPSPGEPPFVHPGDTVDEGQAVCIVEAMKLMNEVTAKYPCVIVKALVENGEPVEFGQPLFVVRPIEQV